MGGNIVSQLKQRCKTFTYYSLALDETNDINDTAQLIIFIRGVDKNFCVIEDIAGLRSKDTTTGNDIFKEFEFVMETLDLKWDKLYSVTTDGAPNMTGNINGLVGHIAQKARENNIDPPASFHCIIHQQALCCKSVNWASVMSVVVSCINFIRRGALKHRQFQEFLADIESEYGDILYHTEIR